MKRRIVLGLAILGSVLVVPASADAHLLTHATAVETARTAASYAASPEEFYSAGNCQRRTRHRVNCDVATWDEAHDVTCRNRVTVYFVGRVGYRVKWHTLHNRWPCT